MCARDITDTFVTAMYTVHSEHILGTDLFRIEIDADQMCHVNVANVSYLRRNNTNTKTIKYNINIRVGLLEKSINGEV